MSVFPVLIILVLAALTVSWYLAPVPWATLLLRLSQRRAGLTSHIVTIDGIRWHFLRGGDGPVLLLLHGFGADTSCWLPLATILRQRFSFVIPDLPGFGESEPPQQLQFNIRAQAERVVSFLDVLDIDLCLVAGNSMGGYLATELAAMAPSRIRGLWLLAPLGVKAVPPGIALEAIDSGETSAGQLGSVREYREEFLPTMFTRSPRIPYPLLKIQADRAMTRQEVAAAMLSQVRFESEPLESIANRVNQPTLIQWGEDDQIVNPAGLPVLGKAFRNVSAVCTPECGHVPMLEQPRESSRLFLEFLAEKRLIQTEK